MRNSLLSRVRQMTSSLQSPRMSAQRHGVDLVPLFDTQPSATTSGVSVPDSQFHLVIQLLSRISRSGSPSHQTPKLHDRGLRSEIVSPLTSHRPESPWPDAHIS